MNNPNNHQLFQSTINYLFQKIEKKRYIEKKIEINFIIILLLKKPKSPCKTL